MVKKYLALILVLMIQQAMAQNYVRTWEARIPVTDASTINGRPVTEVLQTTGYVDGLGRPVQTVVKEGSFMNSVNAKTDMVSFIVYDALGREVTKYLPYAATSNTGTIKSSPVSEQATFYGNQLSGQGETWFYGNSDVEASPLNRIKTAYAPGNNWIGASRGVITSYLNNTSADTVKIFMVNGAGSYSIGSSSYAPGLLTEIHTTDERGKQVVEYKDKDGKVILKKVQIDDFIGDSYTGWLCTYYVYDDYNNLRLVLPPKAVKYLFDNSWTLPTPQSSLLDELAFRYEYDGKNRMSIKKVPGAAEVYMVYDKWDRLVLTQDGNLRAGNKWVFTKYDYLNRPVMTGLYTDATHTGQAGMQSYVDGLMPSVGRYESTNGGSNGYTSTTSFPSISSPDLLTVSFYDDYNWTSAYSSFASMDNSNSSLFYSTGSPLYAQAITASNKTKGMMTGTIAYVINSGSGQKLVSSIFYDDRGRAIQSKTQNVSGSMDITTTQYNFAGQPLMSLLVHERQGSSGKINVITKMSYDDLGRLKEVKKKTYQDLGGGSTVPASPAERIIVQNEYDKLGQLVTKKLAPEFNSNAGLEQIGYEYNIRGWLTSLNKDYLNGSNSNRYFGMELAYDKTGSAVSGAAYTAAQYNGNIAGSIWKTKGDAVNRQYNFSYDNVNRLLKADFKQKNPDNNWNNSIVDFTVKMGDGSIASSAYDENGNIRQMQQWGLLINASTQIDNLNYTYYSNSNKLKSVIDFNDNAATKLGDFRTSTGHTQYSTKTAITSKFAFNTSGPSIYDYGYDVNGNLITDRNKDIGSNVGIDLTSGGAITYNHLNLPSVITVTGKGNITYVYDAAGNKLQKITAETNAAVTYNGSNYTTNITTTTDYIAGFVYESKSYSNGTLNTALGYSGKLQFGMHEEGRTRALYGNSGSPNSITGFAYDYFLKDHLGNVRMVLTGEVQTDAYPAATMETASSAAEETYYSNLPSTRVDAPAYYPPNSPSGNAKVAKTGGGIGNQKIGPAIILKVMAGDKFNVSVNSWYRTTSGQTPNSPTGISSILLSALNNGVGGLAGGKANATELGNAGAFNSGVTSFLTSQGNSGNSSRPWAFLNWILFDEQFNLVSSSSGFEQVFAESEYNNGSYPSNNTKLHVRNDMPIDKNGFLYIYVSNETPNIDVFFDNLAVTHIRGQILEETHYYPFGLTMVGISSSGAGFMPNKKKYNGIEQTTELNLNEYDAFFRTLDPQIGRWWQIDPKIENDESLSAYNSMANNPISKNDPLGDEPQGGPGPILGFNILWNRIKSNANAFLDEMGYRARTNLDNYGKWGKNTLKTMGENAQANWAAGNTVPQQFMANPLFFIGPAGSFGLVKGSLAADSRALLKYEVGTAEKLGKLSKIGDKLDIHHAIQSKPGSQLIEGYERSKAPSIALPEAEHARIPTMKGATTAGSARNQLAKDIRDLRNYTNAPNESLQNLINLNKQTYPNDFIKRPTTPISRFNTFPVE